MICAEPRLLRNRTLISKNGLSGWREDKVKWFVEDGKTLQQCSDFNSGSCVYFVQET